MIEPITVRHHLEKIYSLIRQLSEALIAARDDGVIEVDGLTYPEKAPFSILCRLNDSIDETTFKTRAEAMEREIKESI